MAISTLNTTVPLLRIFAFLWRANNPTRVQPGAKRDWNTLSEKAGQSLPTARPRLRRIQVHRPRFGFLPPLVNCTQLIVDGWKVRIHQSQFLAARVSYIEGSVHRSCGR